MYQAGQAGARLRGPPAPGARRSSGSSESCSTSRRASSTCSSGRVRCRRCSPRTSSRTPPATWPSSSSCSREPGGPGSAPRWRAGTRRSSRSRRSACAPRGRRTLRATRRWWSPRSRASCSGSSCTRSSTSRSACAALPSSGSSPASPRACRRDARRAPRASRARARGRAGGAAPPRLSGVVLHVARPDAGDRGRRLARDRSGPGRVRRLGARPARHLGAAHGGGGALPARARDRALRPRRARLGRADRSALGVRAPGGRGGARDQLAGFFADGKWHGMAQAMREPGTGEQLVDGLDRDGFGAVLRGASPGLGDDALDEYWKAFADETRRRGQLELYRSGDFEKLAGYRLADLAVPVLLVWGESDEFAPLAGAHRFERELPDTELVVVEGAGHFVWEDAPERCAEATVAFLSRVP